MSKFLYLFTPLILLSFLGCDNEIAPSQVPSVVKNTFKQQFPHAEDVEWKNLNNDYEVDFELEDVDYTALLDNTGNLLKHKYERDKTTVPNRILSFLVREYPKDTWEDLEYVKDGNSEYFQLEIDGFINDKKLVVDSLGNVLTNVKYWN